jgi:uncharacterized repeat protein (TIGR01451 family)
MRRSTLHTLVICLTLSLLSSFGLLRAQAINKLLARWSAPPAAASFQGVLFTKRTNGVDTANDDQPTPQVGTPVTWTYEIKAGNEALTNIAVTDDKEGTITCPMTSLPALGTMTCTKMGTAQAGQYNNVGTLTATNPANQLVTATYPSKYFGLLNVPAISLQKLTNGIDANSAPGPTLAAGSPVTWTYVITNTGNEALTDILVTDDKEDLICTIDFPTTISPGASTTCTKVGTAQFGSYSNVGSVEAFASSSETEVRDTDQSHYTGVGPGIDLEKFTNGVAADTPPGPALIIGSTVSWTYVVRNLTGRAVENLIVTDDQGVVVSCPQTTLADGASMTCTATGTVMAQQYRNKGTVTGNQVGSISATVTDSDFSHYFGVPAIAVTIKKYTNGQDADTAPGPILPVGSTVNWTYVVTNTSMTEDLIEIVVTDDQGVTVNCPATTLAPGASMTCTASGIVQPGQYANKGIVMALYPPEDTVVASDMSHYFGQALQLVKATNGQDADTAPGPAILVGAPVNWTYVVTNPGPGTVTNISVTDNKGVVVSCPMTTLVPNASMTCTGNGTATAGQYTNIGTATGLLNGVTITATNPSNYVGITAAVTLKKFTNGVDADTAPGPTLANGAPVTWSYVVTAGNQALTNIVVTDNIEGTITCPMTSLPAMGTMTCTKVGTAKPGQYANLGTVTAQVPSLETVTASDPSHYVVPGAFITIEKATNGVDADTPPGPSLPDDTPITWTYVVTNIGTVPLTNVTVTDDKEGAATCPKNTLAAGESMTCTKMGISQPGQYSNLGTVTAMDGTTTIMASDPSHYIGPPIRLKKATNGQDADVAPGPSILIGSPVTWTYVVTNLGTSTITKIAVTDDKGVAVSCPKTTLQPGESMTCTGNGTATAGQYSNLGTATGEVPAEVVSDPPITVTSTDPSHYIGVQPADLEIVSKTDMPDPVLAGAGNITYTINFRSNGPNTAQLVKVTDAVPTGTTFVSAVVSAVSVGSTSDWTITAPDVGSTGDVQFTKGMVLSGETATFAIIVNVNSSTTGTITNTATVTSALPDATAGNDSKTATTTVNTQADLEVVSKTDMPDPVVAGASMLTYTISFRNNGPSSAQSVTVTDPLPAGTTLVSATPPAGWGRSDAVAVGSNGTIVFTKPTVANGETATFTIVVNVTSGASGTLSNTATAASATTDLTSGNNNKTATTTVNTQADLEIVSKSDSPDPVTAGTNLTYTISFRNNGPSNAQSVTVTDPLPAGTTLFSVTTPAGWARGDVVAVGANGTIVFTKSTVANGETATFTIVVNVAPGTSGTLSNTATAASATTDLTSGNNSKTALTTVGAQADLEITSKTDSPDPVVAGANLTYTINFRNNGPGSAQSVTVTDPLPAGTTLVSATTPAGWARGDAVAIGSNGTIIFTKAAVTNAETATFTITVQVSLSVSGSLSNTATAASTTTDQTTGNNSKTATTTVNCQTITVNAPAVNLGTRGQPFSQTFTQTGGFGTTTFSLAAGTLPAGLTLASNGTLSGTPTQSGSFPLTVKATDSKGCMGQVNYTLGIAVFTGSLTDPLSCTGPGGVVTGTIQLTNPTAAAQAFTLTTSFSNFAGLPGSCTLTGAVAGATCTVTTGGLTASGSIPANTTLTVQYQAQVTAVLPGTILTASNVATLGGAPILPNPLAFTTTVNCPAVGPGLLIADTAPVSDQKPGSVLVYNLYSSSSAAPNAQNTRIAITNTHPALPIAVHLFFVDGATCSIADSLICLTAQQTASFLASDIDPGTTGYLVAVASDLVTGCPVSFNYLIGDEYVKLSSGHAANLAAEGFAAIAGGLPVCDASAVTAILNFDDLSYNRVPRTLAASNIPSRADANDTLIVLNRIGGSLVTGAATLSGLFGIIYDDAENPLSFNFNPGTCQFRSSLSNNFPRLTPRFDQFIPAGRSGWAKFYATGELGLLGAQLNYNPNAGTAANAFNQGHNLHKLTLTQSVQLTIPIFPPNC